MKNYKENDMNTYDTFIATCRNVITNLKNAQDLKDHFEASLPDLQAYKLKPTFLDYANLLFNTFHKYYGIEPFFMYKNEHIAHEWALELYWMILCDCEPTDDSYTSFMLAKLYKLRTNHTKSDKVVANQFAQKLKIITKQFSSPLIPLAYPSGTKYNEYMTTFSRLESNCRKNNGLYEHDYFFYVKNHHSSPYATRNLDTGFLFNNFLGVISEYQDLHNADPKDSFKSEFSAFVFEKLYYGISFEKCICEFFKYNYKKKELPNTYWTIRCFCEFFNTHNLSLIDYFSYAYRHHLHLFCDSVPSNETKFRNDKTNTMQVLYAKFQLYNSFYLPLLFHVLALSLHDLYEGNTERLIVDLRLFITEHISTRDALTYRNILATNHTILTTFKENIVHYDNCKTTYKTLFSEPKNDRIEYKFNKAFTKCFFHLKTTNHIDHYKGPAKNIPIEIIPTALFDDIIFNYNMARLSPNITITEYECLY